MTQFIQWNKTIDAAFRAAYLAKTGEKIQNTPMDSEDGLTYLVGSDRATQAQIDELKTDYPDDLFTSVDTPPAGWVQKVEEIV